MVNHGGCETQITAKSRFYHNSVYNLLIHNMLKQKDRTSLNISDHLVSYDVKIRMSEMVTNLC